MALSPRSLSLTDSYRDRLAAIRTRLERQARATFPSATDLHDFAWSDQLATSVEQAQKEAVRASAGYLTAFLTAELGKPTAGPTLSSGAYAGKTFDDDEVQSRLRSPLIRMWKEWGDGEDRDTAHSRALDRALWAIEMDLMAAARNSLRQGMDEHPEVLGWRRAVKGTCGACMGSTEVETSVELPSVPMNTHPHCQCVTEPVVKEDKRKSPDEAIPPARRAQPSMLAADPKPPFTKSDQRAFWQWSNGDYASLNKFARGQFAGLEGGDVKASLGRAALNLRMTELDTAIEHAGPLGSRVHVYRVVNTGDPAASTWSGLSFPTDVGSMFTDRGFGAATDNFDRINWLTEDMYAPGGGGYIFDMTLDPAVKAVWGFNPAEGELLMQRGCRYLIRGAKYDERHNVWKLEVDVLPPKP